VFSYKPIGLPNRQNYQKGGSFDLEHLVSLFLYELHPEYSTVNSEFIKFIKLISSNLCVRVSWERQQLKNDPNYSMKQFSIQKEDIAYFIDILKSWLDITMQGQTLLAYVSRWTKNLITLDWDSVLSIYILQNFNHLNELVNTRFLNLLLDIVVGVIVTPEQNSKYKYQFLQDTFEYLLEQTKLLDATVIKSVIQIFNIIWAVFPVLPKDWGKKMIEKTHPDTDYNKYMKQIKIKNIQEYQFYKLYEKVYDYAVEYFDLLKSAMNWDLSITNDIIKGFKFLLNAMPPEIFSPLVKDLLECSNQQYSKFILGRIVNNIASRSPGQAKEMLKFWLDHRLLEKDDETGKHTLVSYNFDTNDYYIEILSSAAYHNKEGARAYFNKILMLFKLITENFEEDKHKNDFTTLLRALISPFAKLNAKYPWVINKANWDDLDYQANLWNTLGKLDISMIKLEVEQITQEDIEIIVEVVTDHIFPWIREMITSKSDRNSVKTVSIILTDVYNHICTLFPSRTRLKFRDFTMYYYNKLGIQKEVIDKLRNLEVEMFNLVEMLRLKIVDDEVLK